MREKPKHLEVYEMLDSLWALSKDNQNYLSNLRKGYEGEIYVDSLFNQLNCPHIYLPDRLLKTNRKTFQLDSILITGKGVYLYEIKNYKGEYIFEDHAIKHYVTGKTIFKPSTQLETAETYFKIFLEEYRFNFPVYTNVLFINPEFTLYQMSPRQNIVMPSMMNKHLKELNKIKTPLNASHKRLGQVLNERHITENVYADIPEYTYESLPKGPTCLKCQSFKMKIVERSTLCEECGFKEKNTCVILRKIKEFKILFPKEKINTQTIFDWGGKIYLKQTIRKVLIKNYQEMGCGRGTYYI